MFLEIVYATIRPSLSSDLQIREVLQVLIENRWHNDSLSVPYKMYVIRPVTSAPAGRTFSRMKIIKNYLRSTMTNERPSGLTLISIERELAVTMDFEATACISIALH